MHSRLSTLLIAVLAVAAFGGLSAAANAKQGADDPAGHVRQSRGADDTTRTSAQRRAARHRHRSGHRHHHGATHRADDRGGRRGGRDDGPNHT